MSKRINYPEYADPITNCGRQDGAAITSSQPKIPGAGNGNGSGPSNEERGGGGSNPSPRTIPFKATYAPKHMTHTMCRGLDIQLHHNVLEPSAGSGGMVQVISEYTSDITAVELSGDLFDALRLVIPYPIQCHRGDFLRATTDTLGMFDRIVMCPPKQSVDHLEHARRFLRPDGRMMALVQDQNIQGICERTWKVVSTPDQFQYNDEIIPCSYVLYDGGTV